MADADPATSVPLACSSVDIGFTPPVGVIDGEIRGRPEPGETVVLYLGDEVTPIAKLRAADSYQERPTDADLPRFVAHRGVGVLPKGARPATGSPETSMAVKSIAMLAMMAWPAVILGLLVAATLVPGSVGLVYPVVTAFVLILLLRVVLVVRGVHRVRVAKAAGTSRWLCRVVDAHPRWVSCSGSV